MRARRRGPPALPGRLRDFVRLHVLAPPADSITRPKAASSGGAGLAATRYSCATAGSRAGPRRERICESFLALITLHEALEHLPSPPSLSIRAPLRHALPRCIGRDSARLDAEPVPERGRRSPRRICFRMEPPEIGQGQERKSQTPVPVHGQPTSPSGGAERGGRRLATVRLGALPLRRRSHERPGVLSANGRYLSQARVIPTAELFVHPVQAFGAIEEG